EGNHRIRHSAGGAGFGGIPSVGILWVRCQTVMRVGHVSANGSARANMIERTRRRLRQAQFFYQHLVKQQAKGDPETVRFYFSAFILSARSVTWTLVKEEPDEWKAWKRKWNRSQEEEKLLKITRELRNAEEKQGGADLTEELEEIAVER